jgi:hypothetical protein
MDRKRGLGNRGLFFLGDEQAHIQVVLVRKFKELGCIKDQQKNTVTSRKMRRIVVSLV